MYVGLNNLHRGDKIMTTNGMFVNADNLVIEFHDVIRAHFFSMFQVLVTTTEIAGKLFDLTDFKDMNVDDLFEWYITRKHQNFFYDLPTVAFYSTKEDYDNIMHQMLWELNQNIDIYRLPTKLNMEGILSKLFNQMKDGVRHIYVYGGPQPCHPMELVIQDIYGMCKNKIRFLYGDFKSCLDAVGKDTTYILSDIEKVTTLEELGRIECASILIADGFRYNYQEDDYTKLKVDIDALQSKYHTRIGFFNNLFAPLPVIGSR